MRSSASRDYRAQRREREQQRRIGPSVRKSLSLARRRPTPGSTVEDDGPRRGPAVGAVDRSLREAVNRSQVVLGHLPAQSLKTGTGRGLRSIRDSAVKRPVEVRVPAAPTRRDWPGLLGELAHELDDGRVHGRDLMALSAQLRSLLEACRRRGHQSGLSHARIFLQGSCAGWRIAEGLPRARRAAGLSIEAAPEKPWSPVPTIDHYRGVPGSGRPGHSPWGAMLVAYEVIPAEVPPLARTRLCDAPRDPVAGASEAPGCEFGLVGVTGGRKAVGQGA
jgi:hypothetical protein